MIAGLMILTLLADPGPELYPRSSLEGLTREQLQRQETVILKGRPPIWRPALVALAGLVACPSGVGLFYAGGKGFAGDFGPTMMIASGITFAVLGAIAAIGGLIEFRQTVIARENTDWDLDQIRARLSAAVASGAP